MNSKQIYWRVCNQACELISTKLFNGIYSCTLNKAALLKLRYVKTLKITASVMIFFKFALSNYGAQDFQSLN